MFLSNFYTNVFPKLNYGNNPFGYLNVCLTIQYNFDLKKVKCNKKAPVSRGSKFFEHDSQDFTESQDNYPAYPLNLFNRVLPVFKIFKVFTDKLSSAA